MFITRGKFNIFRHISLAQLIVLLFHPLFFVLPSQLVLVELDHLGEEQICKCFYFLDSLPFEDTWCSPLSSSPGRAHHCPGNKMIKWSSDHVIKWWPSKMTKWSLFESHSTFQLIKNISSPESSVAPMILSGSNPFTKKVKYWQFSLKGQTLSKPLAFPLYFLSAFLSFFLSPLPDLFSIGTMKCP